MNKIDRVDLKLTTARGLLDNMKNAIRQNVCGNDYTEARRILDLAEQKDTEIQILENAYELEFRNAPTLGFHIYRDGGAVEKTFTCLEIATHLINKSRDIGIQYGIISGNLLAALEVARPVTLQNVIGFDTGYSIERLS